MPCVDADALRDPGAHASVSGCVPSISFTELATIASLNVNVSVVPGCSSEPSVIGAPLDPVTDAMRGTIVVVKVHRPPLNWCLLESVNECRVTVYFVRSRSGLAGTHA